MDIRSLITALLALAAAAPLHAQHHHDHGAQHPPAPASAAGPYAGLQAREIKALSAQQVADLRAGKGMSLALPAELNGYPGPSHVLELAGPLQLTPAQAARTRTLFTRMQQEAQALGETVIQAEAALDRLFRSRSATREAVSLAAASAAEAQGRLRAAHLRYHLEMLDVLTPAQVAAYARLRGY